MELNSFRMFNMIEFQDISVYHCGIEKCKPLHHYGPAIRDHFLIHYIIDGQGTFQMDGKTYNLHAGQSFLIVPDVITYYKADRDNPWHYIWVGFNGKKAEEYLKYTGLSRNTPIFTVNQNASLTATSANNIVNCITKMINIEKNYKKGSNFKLQGLLFELLSEMIEVNDATEPPQYNEKFKDLYLKSAVNYIYTHYSEKVQVTDIARFVGIDRTYLYNIFMQSLNISPQRFLIVYRINKACELMKNPLLTISDISHSVGYVDQLTFSKVFKKTTGKSPSQYRESLNKH